MTENEKRQQKAMLLLEFQEAENNLAHVREKVMRVGVDFSEVTTWLKEAGRGYAQSAQANTKVRTNIEKYKKSVQFDQALAAMDELTAAEDFLANLQIRKKDLGLK